MKELKFDNPVFKPLLILFAASSFNDWWSISIGIPTPVQLALLYGIYTFGFKYKVNAVNHFKGLRLTILIYLFVIGLSTLYIYYMNSAFNLAFVTVLFNMIWIVLAMPYLSLGFKEEDIVKFFKLVTYIILFVTIPFGLIELITHKSFMNVDYGLSSEIFYVRGLHIDKLEFAGILAWAIFIVVSFLDQRRKELSYIYLFTLLFLSFLLISVSYSSTAILGALSGVLLIVFRGSKKSLIMLPAIAVVLLVTYLLLSTTTLFNELLASYDLKYELNVNQSSERNFRIMSWEASIEQIFDSPIVGYGIGSSGKVVQEYFISNLNYFTNDYLDLSKEINTHNLLFNEMLDYGLVGTLPLFIALFIIYSYLFNSSSAGYKNNQGIVLLKNVCIGLSVLLLLRFILYYHRYDQTLYVIWMVLMMGLKATKISYSNRRI
jgi:O-antigen ligase